MDIPKSNRTNHNFPSGSPSRMSPLSRSPPGSFSPPKYSSSPSSSSFHGPLVLTEKIPVKTYHGDTKWIQFRRGPVYKEIVNINDQPEIDEDGFQKVSYKKGAPKPQHIYYWHLNAHNMYPFDVLKSDGGDVSKINRPWSKFKKYTLYFCQPDYQIYQNDSFPQYAADPDNPNEVVPLIFYAKWNQVKFKPITFIAKTEDQIKKALQHLSYCVVKEGDDGRLEVLSEERLREDCLEELDQVDLNL